MSTLVQDRTAALEALERAAQADGLTERVHWDAVAAVHATLALAAATVLPPLPIWQLEDVDAQPVPALVPDPQPQPVGNFDSVADFTLARALEPVLDEVRAEYHRAKVKHGDMTLDGPFALDVDRLAALVEEVGEVGRAMTYDRDHAGDLATELVQVANIAITWVAHLRAIEPQRA